ncbi:MAG: CoA transferase, partial [Gammaproteobacteria bacterium]|nr:CoA transferase [Gammaproteobacteria bacterium]
MRHYRPRKSVTCWVITASTIFDGPSKAGLARKHPISGPKRSGVAISALTGRRVLEIADDKGAYCGKLLADMGAEVIKVEPPGGDATRRHPPFWRDNPDADRGLFFLYMNTSKKSITADITNEEGRQLILELAKTCDLVIETLPPGKLDESGLSFQTLRAENPALVLTSITGFGQTGPHRNYKSTDIVTNAMGGAMVVIGETSDPPVTLAGSQASVMASTLAAASSMIALHHSAETGEGQHIDISAQEAMLAATSICGVGKWLEDGIIPRRFGTATFASVPSGTYPCKDGVIYLMVNRPLHWKALARWVNEVTGNEEILDPMFKGPSSVRQPYRELLDLYIRELTGHFSVEEIYREGQRRHLAMTPVNTAHSLVRDHHLCERQFFVEVDHGDGQRLMFPGAPYR